MDNADVYGVQSVASLIESSGKTKFIIRRAGSKSAPLWEYSGDSKQPGKTKNEFINWANTLLASGRNTNLYQISLFNDTDEEESGTKKTKEKPFIFTFALSKDVGSYAGEVPTTSAKNEITNDNLINAVRLVMKEQQESEISKRLTDIESKLEEEDDDFLNGEPEEEKNDTMKMLLGTLAGLLAPKNSGATMQGMAGTPTENEKELLKTAINRLYKIDKDLPADLNKLADIGENNPGQFKFLLNALRNM